MAEKANEKSIEWRIVIKAELTQKEIIAINKMLDFLVEKHVIKAYKSESKEYYDEHRQGS